MSLWKRDKKKRRSGRERARLETPTFRFEPDSMKKGGKKKTNVKGKLYPSPGERKGGKKA